MDLYDQPIRDPEVMARAQATFELCETAEQIMRQNIRRRHPELDEDEVEKRIDAWYRKDPPGEGSFGQPSEEWAKRLGLPS